MRGPALILNSWEFTIHSRAFKVRYCSRNSRKAWRVEACPNGRGLRAIMRMATAPPMQ
jgi:hypothetical protein